LNQKFDRSQICRKGGANRQIKGIKENKEIRKDRINRKFRTIRRFRA